MNKNVRFRPPSGGLKRALDMAPARSAADAVAAADANLAALQPICEKDVEASLQRLAAQMTELRKDPSPENYCELYVCSSRIIGASAVMGTEDVAQLAHTLCDLLDKQAHHKERSVEPLAVLVNSMMFMFKAGRSGADTSKLRSGLGDLLNHQKTAKQADDLLPRTTRRRNA